MISLVTTTKGRPLCFSLLEQWVRRQTVQPDQWLVVTDDWEDYSFTMGQEVVRRRSKKDTLPSICENWLAALPRIRGDFVFVLEDDDWYHPTYLETLLPTLDRFRLAGVRGSLYYKLFFRKFRHQGNVDHAALSATCFTREMLPFVERCKLHQSIFIDSYLWAEGTQENANWTLIPNKAKDGRALHVGMKTMPGEYGLGIGHEAEGSADPALQKLRDWIGADDCRTYANIPKQAWDFNLW